MRGGDNYEVSELGEPLDVGPGGVAFIFSDVYLKQLPQTKASVLVMQSAFYERSSTLIPDTVQVCIVCQDAYLGLANFSKIILDAAPAIDWRPGDVTAAAIHPTARIDSSAQLAPGVVVGANSVIGPNSILLGNAVVGPEVHIGSRCVIFPGVVLYPRTTIGDRVRVHANAVIGSDGFGYARGPAGAVKIWHLGKVAIGNDVEIGAGTTIDRGTIKDTIIEDGAKIDNLVQIGHNGHIKTHAIVCAQVGLAGNVTIGQAAVLAGKVGVADKVSVGDGAVVGAMGGVTKNVKAGEEMLGKHRVRPSHEWRRISALFERLPELFERIRKIERKLDKDCQKSVP